MPGFSFQDQPAILEQMTQDEKQQYLEFAKKIAKEAGEIMKRYFRSTDRTTEWKEDDTPVTAADHEINRFVIEQVKTNFPDHGIIGEEESYEDARELLWVVDPIDGTAPFDLGMPTSTFCLGLVQGGQTKVSVVYDPFTDYLFNAAEGLGSFCGDVRLRASRIDSIKNKYVFMPLGTKEQPGLYRDIAVSLHESGCKTLFIPSFNYLSSLVVSGSGIACFMAYGSPWDSAAISLIAKEAGYMVSDIDGSDRDYSSWGKGIIVAHPFVYDQIIKGLKDAHNWD